MYEAIIRDSGVINCIGTECLYNAAIENNTIIICQGDKCLYDATIRKNVNSIVVNGNNALSGSTIITESYGKTIISINGTNNDDIFNIYCNSTDECFIDCQSSNSCSKLFLHCFGHCYVRCNPSIAIDCPIYGGYDVWTTQAPSSPVANSSNNPTVDSTIISTNISTTDIPTLLEDTRTTDNTITRSTSAASTKTTAGGATTNEIHLALIICGTVICLGLMALIAYCAKLHQTAKARSEFARVPTVTNVNNNNTIDNDESHDHNDVDGQDDEKNDLLQSNAGNDDQDNSIKKLSNNCNINNTLVTQIQDSVAIEDDDDRKK